MTASARIAAAVDLLAPRPGETLFEIGCGTGQAIALILARQPTAEVAAIDRSQVAVAQARKLNAEAIATGRCRIELGDIDRQAARMPVDRVFSIRVNTFWTKPGRAARHVAASLRPGGEFWAIWDEHAGKVVAPTIAGLEGAGFASVRTVHAERAFAVVARALP